MSVQSSADSESQSGSAEPEIPGRILLPLTYEGSGVVTPYQGTGSPAFGRTLSIALAMKGGVSLAVWIGGAVSEIDILRRIRIVRGAGGAPTAYFIADPWTRRPSAAPADPPTSQSLKASTASVNAHARELEQTLVRADQYARLLVSRGYDGVDVDVLAGASAGGLNAVLYSVAQRAGVSVDPLLSTWTGSGSAWRLLRGPGFRSVPSLLRGDDFFWTQVRGAIHDFYGWVGNPLAVAPELTVDLSATISDREYLSSAGAHGGRGHFHFVGADPELFDTDLRPDDTVDPAIGRSIPRVDDPASTNRLAYAARTTSSFPGAFEQARIWSYPSDARTPAAGDAVDMSFAFSAHRKPTPATSTEPAKPAIPFQVLDGGVLDNIPIDRVTRAIRDRTPRSYGDRIAIYLDPSPDALPLSARKAVPSSPPRPEGSNPPGRQSFLGTVGNGIFMRGISESGDDEIAALDELREAALYEAARAASFAQSARELLTVTGAPARDLESSRITYYVLYRAISDADLWKRVLGNPDLWQLTTDLESRTTWPAFPSTMLRTLDDHFATSYFTAATDAQRLSAIRFGSQGLRDAGLCALDWMRDLEDFATWRHTTPAFETQRDRMRTRLHRIARQALRLRDERTLAVVNAAAESPSAASVLDEWLAPNDPQLATLWSALSTEVKQLRRFTTALGAAASDPADWSSPWRWFPRGATAADLAPFVAAEGIPDTVQLQQFAQITAAEATPFEASFSPLTAAQRAEIVSRWLALPGDRFRFEATISSLRHLTLDPGAKLAGSALANFGAFFSRVWRVNDWWWGRLDAAAGLVRVVESLPAPRTEEASPIDPQTAKNLQAAILRQAAGATSDIHPYRVDLAPDAAPETIAANMSAGAHTLAQLRPAYLVSVASRAVRVAMRALRSGQNPIILSALTVVLPPFLSVVPMAFTPLRLVFAMSALFALLPWAAGEPQLAFTTGGVTALPAWALFAAALAISAFPLFGTVTSFVRVSRLKKMQPDGPPVMAPLKAEITRSRARALVLAAISLVALGSLVWRNLDLVSVDAAGIYLALAAIVAAFAARAASRTLAKRQVFAEHIVFIVLTALAVVAIFEPVILEPLLAARVNDAANPAVIVGVGLGLVQASLSWGWLGGFADTRRRWGLILWIVAAGAVAVAAGATVFGISLTQGGAAVPGFVTGLAVWFVASQLGWWIGEIPFPLAADIDDPRFA